MKYLLLLFFIPKISMSQTYLKDIESKYGEINKIKDKNKQGVWVYFRKEDSLVLKVCNYTNDTLNGNYVSYWNSGKLASIGWYKMGQPDSFMFSYWPNGLRRAEVYYSECKLNGRQIFYNDSGCVVSQERYIDGKLDSSNYNYSDSIITDGNAKYKIDTVRTLFNSKWNKTEMFYIQDTLVLVIDYYKNRKRIESIYNNCKLGKRIIYATKRKKSKIKRIYYYR